MLTRSHAILVASTAATVYRRRAPAVLGPGLIAVCLLLAVDSCSAPTGTLPLPPAGAATQFDELASYELGSVWYLPVRPTETETTVPGAIPFLAFQIESPAFAYKAGNDPALSRLYCNWVSAANPKPIPNSTAQVSVAARAGFTVDGIKIGASLNGADVAALGGPATIDGQKVHGARARRSIDYKAWSAFFIQMHGPLQRDVTATPEEIEAHICRSLPPPSSLGDVKAYFVSAVEYANVAVSGANLSGSVGLEDLLAAGGDIGSSAIFAAGDATRTNPLEGLPVFAPCEPGLEIREVESRAERVATKWVITYVTLQAIGSSVLDCPEVLPPKVAAIEIRGQNAIDKRFNEDSWIEVRTPPTLTPDTESAILKLGGVWQPSLKPGQRVKDLEGDDFEFGRLVFDSPVELPALKIGLTMGIQFVRSGERRREDATTSFDLNLFYSGATKRSPIGHLVGRIAGGAPGFDMNLVAIGHTNTAVLER